MFSHDEVPFAPGARIKVIGVGGAGGNAVNTMIQADLSGVEFIAANTDRQALVNSLAATKIQLGESATRGLGAGAVPDVGKQAAMESMSELTGSVGDSDMVFITAGMGGGTGTGAAPVVARAARETGALTVAVVSKPFKFEGRRRMTTALRGLEELRKEVDTIIVVPNERLLAVAGEQMPIVEAFRHVDQVLHGAVKGVSDLINVDGYVNVDFADVRTVMLQKGLALMGSGEASGEGRAREAAEMAISSPLLEDASIAGATGILVNITGNEGVALQEISDAMSLIEDEVDPDANVIFGCVVDESMGDTIRVTVIATGFPERTVESVLGQSTGSARKPKDAFQSSSRPDNGASVFSAPTENVFSTPAAAPATTPQAPAYASTPAQAYTTRSSEMSGPHPTLETRRVASGSNPTIRVTSSPSVRSGSSFESSDD